MKYWVRLFVKRKIAYWLNLAVGLRSGVDGACACVERVHEGWRGVIQLQRRNERTFISATASSSTALVELLSTGLVRESTAPGLSRPECVPGRCSDCVGCVRRVGRPEPGTLRVVRHSYRPAKPAC